LLQAALLIITSLTVVGWDRAAGNGMVFSSNWLGCTGLAGRVIPTPQESRCDISVASYVIEELLKHTKSVHGPNEASPA
jgi:hypothetical protein